MTRDIFVFGSNLAGKHGRGAARYASNHHGAVRGVGEGLTGDSYAIPTKDEKIRVLPIDRIAESVKRFLSFAASHPKMQFRVTAIGCGLEGYGATDIAPLFSEASQLSNVFLPTSFCEVIGSQRISFDD